MRSGLKVAGMILFATMVAGSAWGQGAAGPLPTMKDLQQMYTTGSYRLCLQQIYRVQNLRPDLAKDYDSIALLLLRGNCLLGLRDRSSALIAFTSAEEKGDGDQKIEARATRVLLTATPTLAYQPKGTGADGKIDVINPEDRKRAMMALCRDRLDGVAQQVAKVQSAAVLEPLVGILPQVLDMAALEKTGSGKIELMAPLARSVGDRARALIGSAVSEVAARDNRISQVAGTLLASGTGASVSPSGSSSWTFVERAGLNPDDRATLRQDIDFLTRVQDTVTMGMSLAKLYTGSADRWTPVAEATASALSVATSTLNAN